MSTFDPVIVMARVLSNNGRTAVLMPLDGRGERVTMYKDDSLPCAPHFESLFAVGKLVELIGYEVDAATQEAAGELAERGGAMTPDEFEAWLRSRRQ